MKAWVLALLAVGPALAGCATPNPLDPGARHADNVQCFLAGAEASWTQPGLYDAVLRAGEAGNLTVRSPNEGILVDDPAFLARWREPLFVSIAWEPQTGRTIRAYVGPSDQLHVNIVGAGTEDQVRETFRAFLGHLGLAGHPEAPAWERALLASRGAGPWPAVALVATVEVSPLLERLGGLDNATVPSDEVGRHALQWGPWLVNLRIGQRFAELPLADRTFRFLVDETDQARGWVDLQRGEDPGAVFANAADEAFARLGLPKPLFTGLRGGTGAC